MPARSAGSLSTTYKFNGILMPSIAGISRGLNREEAMQRGIRQDV